MRYIGLLLVLLAGPVLAGDDSNNAFNSNNGQAQGQQQSVSNGNSININVDNPPVAQGGPISLTTGSPSTSSSGGNSSVSSRTNIMNEGDKYEYPASSAATIYGVECQNGVSGQGLDGGAAILTQDAICEELLIAETFYKAWQRENDICAREKPECDRDRLTLYWGYYNQHMVNAKGIADNLRPMAIASKGVGYLAMPSALVFLLFLL